VQAPAVAATVQWHWQGLQLHCQGPAQLALGLLPSHSNNAHWHFSHRGSMQDNNPLFISCMINSKKVDSIQKG